MSQDRLSALYAYMPNVRRKMVTKMKKTIKEKGLRQFTEGPQRQALIYNYL